MIRKQVKIKIRSRFPFPGTGVSEFLWQSQSRVSYKQFLIRENTCTRNTNREFVPFICVRCLLTALHLYKFSFIIILYVVIKVTDHSAYHLGILLPVFRSKAIKTGNHKAVSYQFSLYVNYSPNLKS